MWEKKRNIDEIFRDIAENHEAKYKPDDWVDMQQRLKTQGLQQNPLALPPLNYLIYSIIIISGLSILVPADQVLQNYSQSSLIKQTVNTEKKSITQSDKIISSSKKQILTDKSTAIAKKQVLNDLIVPIKQQLLISENKKPKYQVNILSSQDLKLLSYNIKKNKWINNYIASEKREDSLQKNALLLHDNEVVTANTKENYELKNYHIGLIYPLSSSKANKRVNKISLHVLGGKAAGLEGFELAGVGNIESDYVKGVQFAGLFNSVKKDVTGLQVAGLSNFNGRHFRGVQLAGLANISGYRKIEIDSTDVPLTKIAKTNMQISGLANIDLRNQQNLQISALANVAKKISGVQASIFVNKAENVNGLQMSLFVNQAKSVQGTQIGLFNFCDSIQGLPVGLLSIVRKNGYHKLDSWTSEVMQINVGVRLGVKEFHNIIALGSQFINENFRWSLGYGFGSEWDVKPRMSANFDWIIYHVNESGRWTKELNLLNRLSATLTQQMGSRFALYGGPNLNIMLSDFVNADDTIGSKIAPWAFVDRGVGSTRLKMWVGFNLGIRFW